MSAFLWSHLGSNQGPPDYETIKYNFHAFAFIYIYLFFNDLLINKM
ncbi:conserved hypothetical protein [Chryseobacterium sp. 8AT]|nr:conserved hypothetical protein [Chryseobacterium sp. 8AT]